MGCDIHLHVEVKLNGKWEHLGHPTIDRWYLLFGKMAGVRTDEVEPLSAPKGLPADMSVLTKHDAAGWAGDAHSMSWLGWDEIYALGEWLTSTQKRYLEWEILHMYLPEKGESAFEDLRFVFWFDN